MRRFFPAIALTAVATAAIAHTGVTNPAVMARMEAMSSIADEVKALSGMARGSVEFDAGEVATRMDAIAAVGTEVKVLFEAPEDDPNTEAAPSIWENYAAFTAHADDMVAAAEAGAGAGDPAALQQALSELGETCKSCHGDFRITR